MSLPIEYRICWNASSNITFRGETDWEEWHDDGDPEDVMSTPELKGQPINLPPGLEIVLESCGLDWWVETREAEDAR